MDEGDRRVRRTRAQLRAATLRLLDDGADRLTMASIAVAADVNRSTVHQHYASLDDLICDALADRVAAIAGAVTGCPFAADRDRAPRHLVALFAAVADAGPTLAKLGPSAAARVQDQLVEALAEVLVERFRAGQRPPGFARVRPDLHARYVAAGVIALALQRDPADSPGRLAGQAWRLIHAAS
ncbi:TetR/AcrR family transcriptional regulator [Microlunatus parietis]|uniref:AcrR family transcriptional regulator n=1 Tax=Microlunatus parietis TaxID=682979 RepID=A0A7Y9LCJ0_9ACTN|nr:TetR family transcriptional regulator [Microlunatus parietis]NYE74894.1 AcrR family transcriptional regulator [Microlunatus parietis]